MTKSVPVEQLTHKEGIILIDKPQGKTSFSLVAALRRKTGIQKIGHAGTLDPFATGLMVLLVGKKYTRLSDQIMGGEKEYEGTIHLGIETDSYDCDGTPLSTSEKIPTLEEVEQALSLFQGTLLQTPPMFSAKKINGKKLYELARKGITVERSPCSVTLRTTLINYAYPLLTFHLTCSKGTYVRSIAHELGKALGCGAHLSALRRTRCGSFLITQALPGEKLYDN